ncbi:hypothetical protein [Streptomyces lichenis]|uniref:Tat pathway signal sequence domain protein n=1 Tax=Streptomyces lichenis TaxID=2306967 RepID=A0ABT0IGQ1_9ACTN|nr:hypothetical protein [Streptomyces lichenis]MCK8680508.1 hypothetical protein [Streptomyces lichenis]
MHRSVYRAGLVAAAAAVLALGPAAPGWATTTTTGEVSAHWGDRARVQFTWTDAITIEGGTLTVADLTCDDAPVYAVVTAVAGNGAAVPLATTPRTAGCGKTAETRLVRAGNAAGLSRVTLSICRPAGAASGVGGFGGTSGSGQGFRAGDECVSPYTARNPYRGTANLGF